MNEYPDLIFSRVILAVVLAGLLCAGSACAAGIDVIGTRLILPSPLMAGDGTELQDFVRNQGTSDAGPFAVHYYLNPDLVDTGTGVPVGTWEIAGLKSGALKTGNTTLSIPTTLEPGDYYLFRKIDLAGVLPGEYRANNVQRSKNPITVTGPAGDGIRGLGTVIPSSATAGSEVPVTVIVENPGDEEVSPVSLFFFLSDSEEPGPGVIPAGSLMTDPVPAGEEQEVPGTVLIPGDIPSGSYYFFTSLVPPEEVLGTEDASVVWFNEDLILISSPPSSPDVTPVQPGPGSYRDPNPDIIFLETETPAEGFIGDTVEIYDMIKNNGGSAANIVRVEYGLSPEPGGKNSRHMGWWTTMSLGPDLVASKLNLAGVPSGIQPGFYYITKKITVTSSPPEQNTANNWWVSNVPVEIRYNPADPIPELTHVKTIWPTGQPGDAVQITDTITNIGRGCADSVAVAYYISPYPDFDPGTAEYLGVWNPGSVCPGEQKTNAITVTLPATLTNGEYFLYSIIDPCSFITGCGDGIPEPDKSNNINIGHLVIGPCPFCG
jgi:hypothetical protein